MACIFHLVFDKYNLVIRLTNLLRSIDNVSYPEGMEKLSMLGLNHPTDKVSWPAGLKILEFISPCLVEERREKISESYRHSPFARPIDNGPPAGLQTL